MVAAMQRLGALSEEGKGEMSSSDQVCGGSGSVKGEGWYAELREGLRVRWEWVQQMERRDAGEGKADRE